MPSGIYAHKPWAHSRLTIRVGDRFGRLVITALIPSDFEDRDRRGRAVVKCDCGTEKIVARKHLKNGDTTSCGCWNEEKRFKHGHARDGTRSHTYDSWASMIHRCTNPNFKQFKDYGGRGIRVCERWMSFKNFLADMGEKPPNLTLDRKDNDGNYEKNNCRWATKKQQANNRRRKGEKNGSA